MSNFYVGQTVIIGGPKGPKMVITAIDGDDITLEDESSTFYYHKGDCTLIPYKQRYEQLSLF